MTETDVKTPMMKQYFDVKAENPGALVMFRLGDFYEFFGEDAKVASRELDIVLTGRDAGTEERMPMCGVPHHALEQYLGRLVQKGYRVCICEQLEDPKAVKGLVKRGVVRVVTPGTAMEIGAEEESVFISALLKGSEEHWAMALCEVSTGELRMAEFEGPGSLAELSAEMLRVKPKEILVSEKDYLALAEYLRLWDEEERENSAVTLRPESAFSRTSGQDRLRKQFGDSLQEQSAADKPLWMAYPLAGDCAGAILTYLDDTQKAAPAQIRELKLDRSGGCLVMDPTTFRNLEITRNLRTFEKKGSLLDLMDKTCTAFGARLLRNWLEQPLASQEDIENRLDAVESLHGEWSRRQELRKLLAGLYDMERLMTRVAYQRATPRELVALRQSFEILPRIRRLVGEVIESSEGGELVRIFRETDELRDLCDRLSLALTEDIPNNWKDGGFIRAGYHAEADEYRDNAMNGRTWMLELEQREREKSGIKSLKIGFNKVFGYYFDVTKSNLSMVPDYFQRKQTLVSGERFVTEELLHLEGLVLGAEEKMLALELELFQELLSFLTEALPRVQATAGALARLDVFQSLAELAASGQYCRPRFQPAGTSVIRIKDLRHPVVEQIMERNRYVPNDLTMGEETGLYIITGPNMGGKSTYCRSVALAFVMAQMGSFVAAAEANLPLRDRLFARVGASDDLRGGQSTFMMEMNEVAHILQFATERSLVILDEVGRGTGTYDGLSVAWAVSQYLVSRIRAKTLFATHYLELTELEALYPEVKNLSIAVEEEGERIVFLHKILLGSANKSYGIHVARLAGLPEEVIQGARIKLSALEEGEWREERGPGEQRPGEQRPVSTLADSAQLSLFGDGYASGASDAGQEKKGPEQKVITELKRKDIMKLSPLDALNFLHKLQQSLLSGK